MPNLSRIQNFENSSNVSDLPFQAAQAAAAGRFMDAVQHQVQVVNAQVRAGEPAIEAKKIFGLYLFQAGDLDSSRQVFESLLNDAPDDMEVYENLATILCRLGRPENAVPMLQHAFDRAPDRPGLCDALALTFGKMGQMDHCRTFGRRALELKDAEAAQSPYRCDLPDSAPEPFDPSLPASNIVAFSLWGDQRKHIEGALKNAEAAAWSFPGWTCRFYCEETISPQVREDLKSLGAQVVVMKRPENFYDAYFWRLAVIHEPGVRRYLIRDCERQPDQKERYAIEAWLGSDRYFHVMRDAYSHTDVMMGGLWGGVGLVLPQLRLLASYFQPDLYPSRAYYQRFLREMVWPTVRQSVLCHDSLFTGCLGSEPFPGDPVSSATRRAPASRY